MRKKNQRVRLCLKNEKINEMFLLIIYFSNFSVWEFQVSIVSFTLVTLLYTTLGFMGGKMFGHRRHHGCPQSNLCYDVLRCHAKCDLRLHILTKHLRTHEPQCRVNCCNYREAHYRNLKFPNKNILLIAIML